MMKNKKSKGILRPESRTRHIYTGILDLHRLLTKQGLFLKGFRFGSIVDNLLVPNFMSAKK